jgi:hypothetical protein
MKALSDPRARLVRGVVDRGAHRLLEAHAALAGIELDALDRRVADSAARRVDDALERDLVGGLTTTFRYA